MWRFLVIAWLAVTPAVAQPFRPCPYMTSGWAKTWQGTITSAIYDGENKTLYVIFNSVTPVAFDQVPYSTVQALSNTGNVLAFYNSILLPSFHALFLSQPDSCPLLNENGQRLWTD